MTTIGENLIRLRQQKCFSQEELAHQSGIALRTIQRIEKEHVQPRGHTLRALSEALQVSLEELRASDPSGALPPQETISGPLRHLNSLGLLVILLPVISLVLQLRWWYKHKPVHVSHLSRKIISFQVLWIGGVVFSLLAIHLLTFLLTGQSVYGHFPSRFTAYVLLLAGNVWVILLTNVQLEKKTSLWVEKVPSVL